MKFNQRAVIPVAREPLWDFLMDVPKVAQSLPGVESVAWLDSPDAELLEKTVAWLIANIPPERLAASALVGSSRRTVLFPLQGLALRAQTC